MDASRPTAHFFVSGIVSHELAEHFFSRWKETDIHVRNLPHWKQEGVLSFITFRLGDSLKRSYLPGRRNGNHGFTPILEHGLKKCLQNTRVCFLLESKDGWIMGMANAFSVMNSAGRLTKTRLSSSMATDIGFMAMS